jgi:hypothetical protein
MSNGNFEHRLDALGRSLASGHDGPMPAALRDAIAAKAAAARTTKVSIATAALLLVVAVFVLLPRKAAEPDRVMLDDLESIRRAVAPVWRERVNEGSIATPADGDTSRAGDRGRGGIPGGESREGDGPDHVARPRPGGPE